MRVYFFKKAKAVDHIIRAIEAYLLQKTICSYLPIFLWIEPTNKCNLKCIMCPNRLNSPDRIGFMEWELFKKIIDEVQHFVCGVVLILGGESLLHKDIFRMIRYATDKGIKVYLDTNGTLLNEEKSLKLLDSGIDYLSFSFDGYDKETYEKIRVNAKFEVTLKNIINFLKMKKELGKKKPYTAIQTIIVKSNEKESLDKKREFLKNFEGLPLNEHVVRYAYSWAGVISEDDEVKPMSGGQRYKPCPHIWSALTIQWNGTVVPCCLDLLGRYKLGNVKDKSLLQIWNDRPLVWLREKIRDGKYQDIELCRGCELLYPNKVIFGISGSFLRLQAFILESIVGHTLLRHFRKP